MLPNKATFSLVLVKILTKHCVPSGQKKWGTLENLKQDKAKLFVSGVRRYVPGKIPELSPPVSIYFMANVH